MKCLICRRIISLTELVRKMESIQEQVLPFAPNDLTEAEQQQKSQTQTESDNGKNKIFINL